MELKTFARNGYSFKTKSIIKHTHSWNKKYTIIQGGKIEIDYSNYMRYWKIKKTELKTFYDEITGEYFTMKVISEAN